MDIDLNDDDIFLWRLTSSGGFAVKMLYLDLLNVKLDSYINILKNDCANKIIDLHMVSSLQSDFN